MLHCTVETGILFWVNLLLAQQQVLPPSYRFSSWLYSTAEKYRLQREIGRTDCSGMDTSCKLHHS